MKKNRLFSLSILIILSISITNSQCKKDNSDKFCEIQRSTYSSVDNKEGIIGYYEKYKRWAIYTKVNTPNNIDSRIIGLTCSIPSSLQTDGLAVNFSGTYKTFTANENITPQIGGDELYYLDISKLEKK